jgi:hypothetical protein
MTAEQWLADLEAKAKAAIDTAGWGDMDWSGAHEDFFYAANPATVLRLVAMVRFLAFSAARSRGLFDDPAYWIDTAYVETEKLHG